MSTLNMEYQIAYYIGDKISVKTKVLSGKLSLNDHKIIIQGRENFEILSKNIQQIEMFRLHGLGRMIKIVTENKTIFLTVTRLNILGYFIIINFFKTGKLFKELEAIKI